MNSTRILLTILLTTASASSFAATEPYSSISADEQLVFFDTSAWLNGDTDEWHVPIHGWIYELEDSVARKALFRESLEAAFDLEVDGSSEGNFERRLGLIIADNERGKSIVIEIAGRRVTMPPSAENGHLQTTLTFPAETLAGAVRDNLITYTALTGEHENRRFSGQVHLVPPTGLSIISDIDDTVKITNVTDQRSLLENTFLLDFRPASGMAGLYRQWIGQQGSLHFVSSSPWQLYSPLQEFLDESGFPVRSMHLKPVRFRDETLFDLFRKGTETKPRAIEEILVRYPKRRFVLVGDSGEQDPEVYAPLLRAHAHQIDKVYIRNVTKEHRGNDRFDSVFRGIDPHRWVLFDDGDDVLENPDARSGSSR